MIIENFQSYGGVHCETTATGSLLQQIGIHLSEPMLFGIGEGLGYIFWNMKGMGHPFIGGRVKPDVLTENLCRNLNLDLKVTETTSTRKAWENVTRPIDEGKAVGLKLDCYHLEYFKNKVHFAGHYAALYGYDDDYAYLIDTSQQGGKVKTSLKSLELARAEKGPMSSRNRAYTIDRKGTGDHDLPVIVSKAIKNNAVDFLNPPIKNIGYKGILKTSSEIKTWFKNSRNTKSELKTTAMLMERAGTGGSLFRNLYRDFLRESFELLQCRKVEKAWLNYTEIALLWKTVSELFHEAGETQDTKYINQVSDILIDLSEREKAAMELLV